jgi:hypothetical protein
VNFAVRRFLAVVEDDRGGFGQAAVELAEETPRKAGKIREVTPA